MAVTNLKFATSNEIAIDRGIPLAGVVGVGGHRRGSSKYPFERMEVGDSFLVPACAEKNFSCYARAHCARNHLPLKFSVRKTPEGTRCWRVK